MKSNNRNIWKLKPATIELSTVRLPFRESGGIYETCLFTKDEFEVLERYKTVDDAILGHRRYEKQYGVTDK